MMNFSSVLALAMLVLFGGSLGAVVKRTTDGDKHSSITEAAGHLIRQDVSKVLNDVRKIQDNQDLISSRIHTIEMANQILLREAAFLRQHQMKKLKPVKPSSTPGAEAIKAEVNNILNNIKSLKGQQDAMTSKLDHIKWKHEDLWKKITSLGKKNGRKQKVVNKHVQTTPAVYELKEDIQKVLDAVHSIKEKQKSLGRKIDRIQGKNRVLLKEIVSLKKKKTKKKKKIKVNKGSSSLVRPPGPPGPPGPLGPSSGNRAVPEDEDPDILDAVHEEIHGPGTQWYKMLIFGLGVLVVILGFILGITVIIKK